MNNKTFTFKYDPTISLEKMGEEMLTAVRTGKPHLKLHQISFASLEDLMSEITSSRPKLFACLVEKKPQSLSQLAKLLQRDYESVYKDIQSLAAMGIVKLEKEPKGKEGESFTERTQRIKPVPLYEKIVFDFQVKKVFPALGERKEM